MKRTYAYWRMVWNRGTSHIAVPRAVLEMALLVAILAKQYEFPFAFVWLSAIASIILVIVLGLWDVRKGFYTAEVSLNNRYNPQLMKASRRGK